MTIKFLTPLLLIAFTSCSEQKVNTNADEEQIRANHADWEKIAATGDIDKILFYFSDDAIIMAPGQPALIGKDAIRKMILDSKNIPGFKITWEPLKEINISKSGDLAYVITKNHMTVNDSLGNPITQENKAVTIWRKEADNSWREVLVTFNANPLQNK